MVDQVFTKRRELMPADESVEQHTEKRTEEIAIVETDRNGPNGLFKGLFPKPRGELMLDEADGVLRCPGCGNEHIGGPLCAVCGLEVEDQYGFSDMSDMDDDLDDLEDLELDLDAEVDAEFAHMHGHHHHHHHHGHALLDLAANFGPHPHMINHLHHHHHHPGSITESSDISDSEDDSDLDNDSDDDDNS